MPTIWPITPHTASKHSIFRRHLGAWFPKLAWTGHLRVVDGFAGPGEYTGGEPGSPLIALDVLRGHTRDLSKCRIDFLFVEEDPERFAHLDGLIAGQSTPVNVSIGRRQGSFKDEIATIIDDEERRRVPFPPTFFMIDPFGFEGKPMSLIERLIAKPRSEFLISFMYESINRFLSDASKAGTFTDLFGSSRWREALDIADRTRRWRFLLDLYIAQLKTRGLRYIRPFAMRDTSNQIVYFLVFGTNHKEGMRVMKEAMWRVDPSGNYSFSDAQRSSDHLFRFGTRLCATQAADCW